MINCRDKWCMLIDITNKCGRNCTYCTRYDRHVQDIAYIMNLNYFEKAIESYRGYKHPIGIIGGEPLLLQNFDKYCKIMQKHSEHNYILFTSIDINKSKFKDEIDKTFLTIAYHPHTKEQEATHYHQPLTIAIKDVIKNEQLKKDLINDCWVARRWCGTITNKGGYFCEVGAAIAQIIDIRGWSLTVGWWNKEPEDFGYQMKICEYCGMCIPIELQLMADKKQKISKSVIAILREAQLPLGEYKLFDKEINIEDIRKAVPNWRPGKYKDEQMAEKDEFTTLEWFI